MLVAEILLFFVCWIWHLRYGQLVATSCWRITGTTLEFVELAHDFTRKVLFTVNAVTSDKDAKKPVAIAVTIHSK